VGGEEFDELLVVEAAADELLLRDSSVRVNVHPPEDSLGSRLRGLVLVQRDLVRPHHVVDRLHDLRHLLQIDPTVPIHVVHAKSPIQLLLWASAGGDVDGEEELGEIDGSVFITIEGTEDMITEVVGVPRGEALAVYVHERGGGELAVGAVSLEAPIPLIDGILVIVGVGLEEI